MQQELSRELYCEAAMCLWEEFAAHRDDPLWAHMLEERGTVELRHAVMNLAEPCCRAWEALTEDEQQEFIPYDWEWCPHFLRARVDWSGPSPVVMPKAGS